MTHTTASTAILSTKIAETFVEQHTATITHLLAFVAAVTNYAPGMPGASVALQESMRPLRVPSDVNMRNALLWAQKAIENEEASLMLELQKEAALSTLKAAERHRRDAERLALRARKAWVTISAVNPIVVTSSSVRKPRVSNASHHNVAA